MSSLLVKGTLPAAKSDNRYYTCMGLHTTVWGYDDDVSQRKLKEEHFEQAYSMIIKGGKTRLLLSRQRIITRL